MLSVTVAGALMANLFAAVCTCRGSNGSSSNTEPSKLLFWNQEKVDNALRGTGPPVRL